MKEAEVVDLPAGFRFHPTDEELITHYLKMKVMNRSFSAVAIGEADLNKCEPWDLPQRAKMGEKEWYFFCQRDRKYSTGMRTNRATELGYWKATGKDREIYRDGNCLVGMKKTLVFYRGRAPKGEKTDWVMHEFRLEAKLSSYDNFPKSAKDEWVLCRVFHKTTSIINKSNLEQRMNSSDNIDISWIPSLIEPGSSVQPGSSSTGQSSFINNNSYNNNNLVQIYPTVANQNPSLYPQESIKNLRERFYRKEKRIKMEHFSANPSTVSVSQDTGLSSDINATTYEISSGLVSKPFDDLGDLGILWGLGYE